MRIVVAEAHDPFDTDLNPAGHPAADRSARTDTKSSASRCRSQRTCVQEHPRGVLLNLARSNLRPVDLVVATGFPAYCIRHPARWQDFHHTRRARRRPISLTFARACSQNAHAWSRSTGERPVSRGMPSSSSCLADPSAVTVVIRP
jgi:hypothetical protein